MSKCALFYYIAFIVVFVQVIWMAAWVSLLFVLFTFETRFSIYLAQTGLSHPQPRLPCLEMTGLC